MGDLALQIIGAQFKCHREEDDIVAKRDYDLNVQGMRGEFSDSTRKIDRLLVRFGRC